MNCLEELSSEIPNGMLVMFKSKSQLKHFKFLADTRGWGSRIPNGKKIVYEDNDKHISATIEEFQDLVKRE